MYYVAIVYILELAFTNWTSGNHTLLSVSRMLVLEENVILIYNCVDMK